VMYEEEVKKNITRKEKNTKYRKKNRYII
jgi:hypothetical protein